MAEGTRVGSKAIKVTERETASTSGAARGFWRPAAFWQWLSGKSSKELLFVTGDTVALLLSHFIARAIAARVFHIPSGSLDPEGYQFFYLPFLTGSVYLFRGYASPDLRRPEKELVLIFKAVPLSFLGLICSNFIFWRELGFSRYLIIMWYFLTLISLIITRFSLRAFYGILWKRGLAQQSALLIGSPEKLARYQRVLSIQRYHGYRTLGIIPAQARGTSPPAPNTDLPVLGSLDNWEQVASQHGVQLIIVSLPVREDLHEATLHIVRRCQEKKLDVEVFSDLFSCSEFNYELDEFSGFFRFYGIPRWNYEAQRFAKLVLDRLIGLVGSLVTLLIMPAIFLLLKIQDNGPIFYRSAFLGQDGNVHYYLKFRTMRIDADRVLADNPELRAEFEKKFKLSSDPRVTRMGSVLRKLSLDEFPQFFSVLTGQLSFVGPRTIREEEGRRYGQMLPRLLSVKPGLTGFWQVMGRQTTTYDERIDMDMFYIDHWSIWLDLVIIGRTLWKVLRAEGAY